MMLWILMTLKLVYTKACSGSSDPTTPEAGPSTNKTAGGTPTGPTGGGPTTNGTKEKIINGWPAGRTEATFIARYDHLYCGGTLISQSFVLTAAHCIHGDKTITLHLGDYDMSKMDAGEQIRKGTVIVHEQYTSTANGNDIALIKLHSPVQYSQYIKKAEIMGGVSYKFRSVLGLTLDAWGWGRHIDPKNPNIHPDVLHKTNLMPMTRDECLRKAKKFGLTVAPNALCLIGVRTNSKGLVADTCFGDSGGPITYQYGSTHFLVGIVSYGTGDNCGVQGAPAMYTDVRWHLPWIQKHTGIKLDRDDPVGSADPQRVDSTLLLPTTAM